MFTTAVLFIFSGLMIWAAISDIRNYIISNRLCLCVALLYPLYLLSLSNSPVSMGWEGLLWSIGLATLAFMIGLGLFALNIMGGGDVKLIPLVILWAGPKYILSFLFIMAVAGGLISLVFLIKKYQKISKYRESSDNINFPMSQQNEEKIPYGVGIAVGGLFVAWKLYALLDPGMVIG